MFLSIFTTARETLCLVCNTIAMYIATAGDAIIFVVDTNFHVVSRIVHYVSCLFSVISCVAKMILTMLVHCYEFIYEFGAFLYGIVLFIWNVLMLLYKILCFIYTGAETMVLCLFTGSYTALITLKQSATDIVDNCYAIWNGGIEITQELVNTVVGGFYMIGNVAVGIVKTVWWSLGFTFASVLNILCNCYSLISDTWNKLVSTATSAFTVSKEVYIGVVIICFFYLVVSNLILYVRSKGINFKYLWQRTRRRVIQRPQYDFDDDFESDVDILDEENEEDDTDDSDRLTVNSNDSNSENEISDDDDDVSDGSVNSQTFSSESDQEIEISLPEPATDGYSLRSRSSTPSILKNLSNLDFAYEIEKEKDKRKCVVCQDRSKCVLVLPCRHMCLCVNCANQIVHARLTARRVCPLCRQQIEKVMNVYV